MVQEIGYDLLTTHNDLPSTEKRGVLMSGNDGRVFWNHSLNGLKQQIKPNKVMQHCSEVMKLILEHLINS